MRPMPMITVAEPGGGNLMKKQSWDWPAVEELWMAWEIHSLILASLFLQVFLFLCANKRKRTTSSCMRLVLWLAYLSADSVAVFVLGHLAVRASSEAPDQQRLMSFWAPFVLIHLGGQDTMTAFSMQDNELWQRHLLNLVIQASLTGYVVGKTSWPDHRLRSAMVLVFISGFFKYGGRTLYLFFARPEYLTSPKSWKLYGQGKTSYTDSSKEAGKDMGNVFKRMSKGGSGRSGFMEAFSLTTDIMAGDTPLNTVRSITLAEKEELHPMLESFLSDGDRHKAYELVEALLVQCYSRLYTKGFIREVAADALASVCKHRRGSSSSSVGTGPTSKPMVGSSSSPVGVGSTSNPMGGSSSSSVSSGSTSKPVGGSSSSSVGSTSKPVEDRPRRHFAAYIFQPIFYWAPTFFPYVATPVALALFVVAEKGDTQLGSVSSRGKIDIMVSYLLLVGAIALDVSSFAVFIFSRFGRLCKRKQWSQELKQYNMIDNANKAMYVCSIDLRSKFGRDLTTTALSADMKGFILDTLLASGTRQEWEIASTRGNLAFYRRCKLMTKQRAIQESVKTGVDFPRSVLIWHIATHLCFHQSGDKDTTTNKKMSKELSEYIMYLVFKCRVMLTTYSEVVHDKTRAEIAASISRSSSEGKLLLCEDEESRDQDDATKEDQDEMTKFGHGESSSKNDVAAYMRNLRHNADSIHSSQVLPLARELAKELISIKDEAERWGLIAEVWAEMLYYTAPRCGAAFHAEHLATGGEFVTHVFVLMYLLGPFMPPPGA